MMSLFVTGATGLIGRNLVRRLDASRFGTVFCLTRRVAPGDTPAWLPANGQLVRGDLNDSGSYAEALSSCETVVHLAAATGKAPPGAYEAANVKGTATLVAACREAGVRQILHVSTIAARYRLAPHLHYARSKRQSEEIVRRSGLRYTIARPTIVLAPDSRLWHALRTLARLPRPVVFGDGRTSIQPIGVDDLTNCLLAILDEQRFRDETLELGGSEPIAVEDFVRLIRLHDSGQAPRVLHIPVGPIRALLSPLEPALWRLLPLTAGQLAVFTNDGAVEANELHRQFAPGMQSSEELIQALLGRRPVHDAVFHAR